MDMISQYVDVAVAIHSELLSVRAALGQSKGFDMTIPAITSTDMLAAITLFTSGVVNAVYRISDPSSALLGVDSSSVRCLNTQFIADDGTPNVDELRKLGAAKLAADWYGWDSVSPDFLGIDAKRYVSGYANTSEGWQRSLVPNESEGVFPFFGVTRSDDLELLAFLRSTMRAWERVIAAIRSSIDSYGLTRIVSLDAGAEFFVALTSLGSSLDVCGENPPSSYDVHGAFMASIDAVGHTLESASRVAGETAGKLANIAGSAAGEAAKGFLDTAGISTLAVAAVAVYIAVQAKLL